METCLTPNHLLFGRQLLHSSNTISTVVRNLTILSSTTDKINYISNHFLDWWRHEFTRDTTSIKINVNDIVLVFYEKVLRHFWRIAIVTRVLPSRDSEIREAIVRIAKTNTILKRPVVENTYHDTNQTDKASHKEITSLSLAALPNLPFLAICCSQFSLLISLTSKSENRAVNELEK